MRGCESKEALIAEIRRTAALFVAQFDDVAEADADELAGVEMGPREHRCAVEIVPQQDPKAEEGARRLSIVLNLI